MITCALTLRSGRTFILGSRISYMEKIVADLTALRHEAQAFAAGLTPKAAGATLVTLSGELGAGKTAFTKAVAQAYGVEDVVTSPTFVLEKIYTLPREAPFSALVHIDAYRLEKGADLAPLGFDGLMREAGNLVLLEWPERVEDTLPPADVAIRITPHPGGSRTLAYA